MIKRPKNTEITPFLAKHRMFRAKNYPQQKNIRASVTNCMSGLDNERFPSHLLIIFKHFVEVSQNFLDIFYTLDSFIPYNINRLSHFQTLADMCFSL